jgi:hypothetical protein
MIKIEERYTGEDSVSIQVDGIIDRESLPSLKEVMRINFMEKKKITLNLTGLMQIDREGTECLKKFRNKVKFKGLPEFFKLEIGL